MRAAGILARMLAASAARLRRRTAQAASVGAKSKYQWLAARRRRHRHQRLRESSGGWPSSGITAKIFGGQLMRLGVAGAVCCNQRNRPANQWLVISGWLNHPKMAAA